MEQFRVYGLRTPEESARELENRRLARKAAAEGMVLLKNEGVLPIREKQVALYGAGARMTVRGGTGSGDAHERYSVNIEDGLKAAGIEIVNTKWMDRFDKNYREYKEAYQNGIEKEIKDYTMEQVMEMFEVIHSHHMEFPVGERIREDEIAQGVETAIYVIARQAGEGADRQVKPGDFLPDETELFNLRLLAQRYKKVLLVINCGGIMDLSLLEEIPGIGGVLYFGQGGTEGGNAFADLVTGKVSPSGKLADTWGKKYWDYPCADTYSYLNGELLEEDYAEGIYVGYRYFDAFHKEPRYEFGFGLSYTTFSQTLKDCQAEGGRICLQVEVKNTGDTYAGREVVQVYVTKPEGRARHEVRSLAAFAKTALLGPGRCETVTLSFGEKELASFDQQRGEWYLEAGDYLVCVGSSSRRLTSIAVVNLKEEVVVEKTQAVCQRDRWFEELVPGPFGVPEASETSSLPRLSLDPSAFSCIRHSYEKPAGCTDEKVSRILDGLSAQELAKLCVGGGQFGSSFNITPGCVGRTTSQLLAKGVPNINMSDGPAGLNLDPETVVESDGTVKYLNALPENVRWGCVKAMEAYALGSPDKGIAVYQYYTAWPAAHLLAQTWNTELMEAVGRAVAEEMRESGTALWLAPAMNIHRNPLCGRNFEYYSEDPLLSGRMAAALTRGVQSVHGVGVTVKHFCCNNQESNRTGVSENLSERALREIYLRGFRYVVEEAAPMALMSPYNKVNGRYVVNSFDLLTRVLRCEWGYEGLVMSDWSSTGEGKGDYVQAIKAGNDLIMPGDPQIVSALAQAVREGALSREELTWCASHVLKAVFESFTSAGF